MIDKNYFKSVKILDGGMGQQLLSKGLQTKGSLWSASALLEEKYHKLVVDAHLDFINAGADNSYCAAIFERTSVRCSINTKRQTTSNN